MRICIILGTRPEVIKMAPVIRECEDRKLDYFTLHTGQHYSYNLSRIIFQELDLPHPRYGLDTGSGTHAEETAKMLTGVERILVRERPDVVLVEGDTNTVLAGALAAVKLYIGVGHVEAGLRSYDRRMPEEFNRMLVDSIADYLFAPTRNAERILLGEGAPGDRILVTGNTIVDSISKYIDVAESKSEILKELKVEKGGYFLVTLHREENVDDHARLMLILNGFKHLDSNYDEPLIYPIHPRTRRRISEYGLERLVKSIGKLVLVEPLGFLDFLMLEANANLVLTDSGGVQEESCYLRVPCVTLRESTERPETLEVGSNTLAGTHPQRILEAVREMLNRPRDWKNPFGDGRAGERIVEFLENT